MKQRLLSLDVLRGITVFGMIVVNNAGGKYSYDSLQHSVWNGSSSSPRRQLSGR